MKDFHCVILNCLIFLQRGRCYKSPGKRLKSGRNLNQIHSNGQEKKNGNNQEAAEKEKGRDADGSTSGTDIGGQTTDIRIGVVNVVQNDESDAGPVDLTNLGIVSVPSEVCHVAPGMYHGFPTVTTPGCLSHDPIYIYFANNLYVY